MIPLTWSFIRAQRTIGDWVRCLVGTKYTWPCLYLNLRPHRWVASTALLWYPAVCKEGISVKKNVIKLVDSSRLRSAQVCTTQTRYRRSYRLSTSSLPNKQTKIKVLKSYALSTKPHLSSPKTVFISQTPGWFYNSPSVQIKVFKR